ncbi:hypothetical protein GCM10010840_23650 [Deinococcus aerolatus]|uniref:Uncharacterized protein n=1 Tax=Deinococcus aerolatus TaxID=522487 RepID=A0ABQ2GBM9_9DEIO|nr:hypothetical protein GCM10010840_23650 [Deinococcus aerolatus]
MGRSAQARRERDAEAEGDLGKEGERFHVPSVERRDDPGLTRAVHLPLMPDPLPLRVLKLDTVPG